MVEGAKPVGEAVGGKEDELLALLALLQKPTFSEGAVALVTRWLFWCEAMVYGRDGEGCA